MENPEKKAKTKKKWRKIDHSGAIEKPDPDLKTFIRLNWDSIRTFSRRELVQYLFSFYI